MLRALTARLTRGPARRGLARPRQGRRLRRPRRRQRSPTPRPWPPAWSPPSARSPRPPATTLRLTAVAGVTAAAPPTSTPARRCAAATSPCAAPAPPAAGGPPLRRRPAHRAGPRAARCAPTSTAPWSAASCGWSSSPSSTSSCTAPSPSRRCCAGGTRVFGDVSPAEFVPLAEESAAHHRHRPLGAARGLPHRRRARRTPTSASPSTSPPARCAAASWSPDVLAALEASGLPAVAADRRDHRVGAARRRARHRRPQRAAPARRPHRRRRLRHRLVVAGLPGRHARRRAQDGPVLPRQRRARPGPPRHVPARCSSWAPAWACRSSSRASPTPAVLALLRDMGHRYLQGFLLLPARSRPTSSLAGAWTTSRLAGAGAPVDTRAPGRPRVTAPRRRPRGPLLLGLLGLVARRARSAPPTAPACSGTSSSSPPSPPARAVGAAPGRSAPMDRAAARPWWPLGRRRGLLRRRPACWPALFPGPAFDGFGRRRRPPVRRRHLPAGHLRAARPPGQPHPLAGPARRRPVITARAARRHRGAAAPRWSTRRRPGRPALARARLRRLRRRHARRRRRAVHRLHRGAAPLGQRR